jgi:putative hydrolase of the HAD superfamily
MIGNSLKSDILPLVGVGANAIHIPYHTTWAHEEVAGHIEDDSYRKVDSLLDILNFL